MNCIENSTVQSLYNTPHYNTDLDITRSDYGFQFFYDGILQRNHRKITLKWSIPFIANSFLKCPFIAHLTYSTVLLYHSPFLSQT